ncbi:MAG: outer membrane protein beta-barrel domain [Gammaproteobacteria bacterium]|nr:outer membrane protein beta-barrel domain [Gammaproteobacteria bacterium]
MNKFNLSVLATALFAISTAAFADVTAQNGFYVGVDGGQGSIQAPDIALTNNWFNNVENYATSSGVWGAYAGYHWAVNQNVMWGAELGYSQNGRANYAGSGMAGDTGSLTYNSSSVNILGTLTYVGEYGINGFVKLGAAVVTQTADVAGPVYINGVQQSSQNTSVTQTEPMIGLGVGYMPTQNFNIYAEIEGTGGDFRPSDWGFFTTSGYNSSVYATSSFRLGLSYLF